MKKKYVFTFCEHIIALGIVIYYVLPLVLLFIVVFGGSLFLSTI